MSSEKIRPGQVKKLWAAARQAGLNSDGVHELLEAEVGERSVQALTLAQAAQVIDRLVGRQRPVNAATVRQVCLLRGLARDLGWKEPERLQQFCERMHQVTDPWLLETWQASKVIEGLKAMAAREKTHAPASA